MSLSHVEDTLKDHVRRFGRNLDYEDCLAEAWIAYLEALNSYRRVQGCCGWEKYLSLCVQEQLQALRSQRNQHIQIHSSLSLDHPSGEGDSPAGNWLPAQSGNFERTVLFRDYIGQLRSPMKEIAHYMAQGDSPEEVMECMSMTPAEFSYWTDCLREQLEKEYL